MNMNNAELSLLGFLAESMVASNDGVERRRLLAPIAMTTRSTSFRAAVNIMEKALKEIPQSSPPEVRLSKIRETAHRLSQDTDSAAKSVGTVLEWALAGSLHR